MLNPVPPAQLSIMDGLLFPPGWLRLTLMGPVEMKTAKRWNSRVLDTAVAEVDDNEGSWDRINQHGLHISFRSASETDRLL